MTTASLVFPQLPTYGFASAASFGIQADGVTDEAALLMQAAQTCASLGTALQLGDGTIVVNKDGANAWCVNFDSLDNLVIRGVKGKSKIKAAAGMPNSIVPIIRVNNCKNGGIYDVEVDGNWGNWYTAVSYESSGQVLGAGPFTIYVEDTSRAASSGTFGVVVGTTLQTITYTGKTANSFTGCSGGTGTLKTGAGVGLLDANTGINHTTQIDPRNHGIMLRGCTNFAVIGVTMYGIYGDGVWIGFRGDPGEDGTQPCRNIRLERIICEMTARHGMSVSQAADGITVEDCEWLSPFGLANDTEAQGTAQYVNRLRINGGVYGLWWNPTSPGRNSSYAISIKGAGVVGLLDADGANACSVSHAEVRGGISVWSCRGLTLFKNNIAMDHDHGPSNTSYAPIFVDHTTDAVDIIYNTIYDRGSVGVGAADGDPSRAAIVVQSYAESLRPTGVKVMFNNIRVRNLRDGIKASGGGGYLTDVQNYTATSTTSTTATVTGAGWTVNQHAGKNIYLGGLIASVVANTSDTLTHTGWFRPYGTRFVEPTPAAGAMRLIMPSAPIVIEGNIIDCLDDGYGAGGHGVSVYTKLSGSMVKVRNNTVRSATGAAYYFDLTSSTSEMLEVTGNYAYDDQQVQTTTYGCQFLGTEFLTQLILHGNNVGPGIEPYSGPSTGHWISSSSFLPSYTGYDNPEGTVAAPAQSTYTWLSANTTFQKQTSEAFDTGWVAIKTAPRIAYRSSGALAAGVQNALLTVPVPASVVGDIELMQVLSNDADGDIVLSTPSGFAVVGTETDTHLGFTIRMTVLARRVTAASVAPVVDATGGSKFAIAQIHSYKDCASGGPVVDVVDATTTLTHSGGALAFSLTGPTSTVDGALFVTLIGTHTGSSLTWDITDLAYSNPAMIELTLDKANTQGTLGDRYSFAAISARRIAAGASGDLTGNITSDSYSFTLGMTLALVPSS